MKDKRSSRRNALVDTVRLQSLTRDLDAAAVIDDTTFRRAARACADFVRHTDLAIRGRAQPETVHSRPL